MMTTPLSFRDQLIEEIDRLNADEQQRLLNQLRRRQIGGVFPMLGTEAIRIARELAFDPEELAQMERDIEEAFEQIEDDPDVNFDE